MQLALARYPHLRAMVGAPLTLRDVPYALGQVLAVIHGRTMPKLPEPVPRVVRRVVNAVTRPISALWGERPPEDGG